MVKTLYCFFNDNGKCVYHVAETRVAFAQIRAKHALGLPEQEVAALTALVAADETGISYLEEVMRAQKNKKGEGEK